MPPKKQQPITDRNDSDTPGAQSSAAHTAGGNDNTPPVTLVDVLNALKLMNARIQSLENNRNPQSCQERDHGLRLVGVNPSSSRDPHCDENGSY